MRGRDWRAESLDHLRRSYPSWLTGYEIVRKIRSGELTSWSGSRSGRDATKAREACEQMVAEGLLERREIAQEGAPYGKKYAQYRAVLDPDTAFHEMVRLTEELGLYDDG